MKKWRKYKWPSPAKGSKSSVLVFEISQKKKLAQKCASEKAGFQNTKTNKLKKKQQNEKNKPNATNTKYKKQKYRKTKINNQIKKQKYK